MEARRMGRWHSPPPQQAQREAQSNCDELGPLVTMQPAHCSQQTRQHGASAMLRAAARSPCARQLYHCSGHRQPGARSARR